MSSASSVAERSVLVVRSTRVVLPEGERPALVYITGSFIERVADYTADAPTGALLFDAGNLVVSPGVVDTHVHVNEPGRAEWEGFDTATRAAAAGGVTTIVDMPLNSVPATTTVSALYAKVEAAVAQSHVDVGFWGGVVPGNESELEGLIDAGVRGFKCFLVPSGVAEFEAVDEDVLRRALPILARRDVPLLVHAELPLADRGIRIAEISDSSQSRQSPQSAIGNPQYATYLATRPPAMEVAAIRLMARLAAEFSARVHIVHVSSADGANEIARAKASGIRITAETCPHYLMFCADDIPDGATEFKCAPPIREAAHRDALWAALMDGTLDLVATDHSPAPAALKHPADFMHAWGGIGSLELSLPAVWTRLRAFGASAGKAGAGNGGASAAQYPETAATTAGPAPVAGGTSQQRVDLARWLSAAPAALAGLADRKGRIEAGLDADLVIWNPDESFVVKPDKLHQRHKLTPYLGRRLFGAVHTTFVRGERVWDRQRLIRAYGGRLL
jgi:allantoinase